MTRSRLDTRAGLRYISLNTPATRLALGQYPHKEACKRRVFYFPVTKIKFAKPALSPNATLSKLLAQGLVINPADQQLAQAYFESIGGHRLKGYWWRLTDQATKAFLPGQNNFRRIVDLVEFDQKLRALLWPAIETVEVSVRSALGNYLSIHHSPHWFLDPKVFKPTVQWAGSHLKKVEDEVNRSMERRPVAHYYAKYDDPHLPPSWLVGECLTLGFWSRTYAALREPNDRKAIAKRFGIDQPEVFESWLHSLTYVRNIVAHHGQMYGVAMRIAPQNYKGNKAKKGGAMPLNLGPDNKSIHAAAKLLNYMARQTGLPQSFKADLVALLANAPPAFGPVAGFPNGWSALPGW